MASIPSDRPGSELIDLSGQVSNGDDLPSAIQDNLSDGVQIYIPPGEYTGSHSDLDFSADDATIYGDPAGVSIDCEFDSNATMDTAGTLRIENIDIRGEKPEEQIKIDVDLSGGRLEWVNFNFPDGTADPTDSYVARCDSGSGHHFMQNCYIGPHGNSAFYYSERDSGDMEVTWKGCAFHNAANPIRACGVLVDDCIYVADGDVPNFKEEGSSSEDEGTPRMVKFEGDGNSIIRNSDVLVTSDAGPADGPCIDWGGDATDSSTVDVVDSRFANELGREAFDTASAPGGVAGDSSLSNVSVTTEPVFSGDEIPGDVSSGAEPRSDIESRRWNPLEGSGGDTDDSGADTSEPTPGFPEGFQVVTGSDATPPNTDYEIWTPVEGSGSGGSGNGSGGDGGETTYEHTILLQAGDNPEPVDVSFTADGEIEFGPESEAGTDEISDNGDGTYTATSVSFDPNASDSYRFNGDLLSYSLPAGTAVAVTYDGTETTFPELLGEEPSEGGDADTRTVSLIASSDNPDPIDVSFTADGDIEYAAEAEPDTDEITENGDGTVTATSVSLDPGASDSYRAGGSITAYSAPAGAQYTLLVDGTETTFDDLGATRIERDDGASTRRLTLTASADNPEPVDVSFTADGEIAFGPEAEPGTDELAENGDGTVTATSVSLDPGASDSYEIAGPIVDYSVPEGAAVAVSLDGTETSFENLVGAGDATPARYIVIDGTGDAVEVGSYLFSVTGTVERDEDRSQDPDDGNGWDRLTDLVSDETVVGVVGNGVDAYRFTGELVEVDVRGDASYTVVEEDR